MAPEWNARARAGWFGMTAAHGRAHLARALLEGNALALRDVIEAIAGAGHAPFLEQPERVVAAILELAGHVAPAAAPR
jgi:sugar (pentulose or hexulose) kinase